MSKKILLSESELKIIIKKIISEALEYNSEVEQVQKELKGKYNLGSYGINKDGVDGKLGKLTRKALKKEFEINPEFKKKYQHLLSNEEKKYKKDIETVDDVVLEPKNDSDVAIFVSGLHHRRGDLSVSQQEEKIRKGLTSNKTIFSFSHNNYVDALNKLNEYPNAIVVLFSMGTGYSSIFASKIKNKSNLFIVEPYPKASNSVKNAVSLGVPTENVILGGGPGSGKGMIQGATNTPREYAGHWPALTFVGGLIS